MATGAAAVRATAKGLAASIPSVPGLEVLLVGNDMAIVAAKSGQLPNVMALAQSGSVTTLSDAAQAFVAAEDVGQMVIVSGATNAANNGRFIVTARPTATTITYTNAVGVTESPFSGSYQLPGRGASIVDRKSALSFTQPTMAQRFPRIVGNVAQGGLSSDPAKICFGRLSAAVLNWQCVNALFGNYNGNIQCVNACWFGRVTGAPGGTGTGSSTDMFAVVDTTAAANASFRFRVNGPAGALTNNYLRTAASASTTWNTALGYNGNRGLLSMVYDFGLNEMATWAGTTSLGSVSQPTPRSPTGLAMMVIGSIAAAVPMVYGGVVLGRSATPWGAAELTLIQNYFNAEYPP
jgi:hypothetical protein